LARHVRVGREGVVNTFEQRAAESGGVHGNGSKVGSS
jgi:hypothetical protein